MDFISILFSLYNLYADAEVIDGSGVEMVGNTTESNAALSEVDLPPPTPSLATATMPTSPPYVDSKIDIHESDLLGVFLSG
jgi:hypothetical protein